MDYVIYFLQFIGFWSVLILAGMILGYLIHAVKVYKLDKKTAENDYNMLYLHIEAFLEKEPSVAYYYYIFQKLKELGRLEYKNREKTTVLTTTFFRKYIDYVKAEEDEFGLEQLNIEEAQKRLNIMNKAKAIKTPDLDCGIYK